MPRSRKPVKRVIFRDVHGKFVASRERYTDKVASVQVFRTDEYVTVMTRKPTPESLADLLNQREFESLPEALVKIKDYAPRSKYQAWNLAEQIDKTKRLRRKQLKITLKVRDGKALRTIEFYHQIKRNAESSYSLFRRINQEVGIEGFYLYDRINGKMLADRRGKKVTLESATVEEIK